MIVIAFILILLLAIWLGVKLGGVRKLDAGDQPAMRAKGGKLRRQEAGNDDRVGAAGREDGFQGGGGRFGGGASGDWEMMAARVARVAAETEEIDRRPTAPPHTTPTAEGVTQ
jgi:hypothetical protein